MSLSTVAVGGALVLDVLVGEPRTRLHPVAAFGRVVGVVDRSWDRPRLAGLLAAATLPLAGAATAAVAAWALAGIHPVAGVGAATLVVFVTTSFRALLETVARVSRLVDDDLAAARRALRALAGRNPSSLDAAGVRSGAVESLAENLSDGLVAPLVAFAIGAVVAGTAGGGEALTLALACACAVWIKCVNTMDSMLGYHDRPHGTASARLDDAAMWIPARVTALLLALAFLAPGALAQARHWTDDVASPNAGWPMGTLAAALDVRLAKPGHYVLNPDGATPTHAHVRRALGRVGLAGLSAYALVGVVAWS